MDWLKITAFLRTQLGLHGTAGDFRADALGDTLNLRAPGYSADLTIDPRSGSYTASTDAQGGWPGRMTCTGGGRGPGLVGDPGPNLAGYFLTLIALTGLGQLRHFPGRHADHPAGWLPGRPRDDAVRALTGAGLSWLHLPGRTWTGERETQGVDR